jgi:hypothetical protein
MLLTFIIAGAIVLFILDTLRLRHRVSQWQRVPAVGAPDTLKTRMVAAPGVSLPNEARERAERWMEVEGIQVLDLIPMNLDGLQALALAMFYDPESYRNAPFERGRSALHCLLAREELAERASIQGGTAANPAVVARAAHHGKRFAPRSADIALMSGLDARPEALAWRRQVMTEAFGGNTRLLFYVAPVLYALLFSAFRVRGYRFKTFWALLYFVSHWSVGIGGLPSEPCEKRRIRDWNGLKPSDRNMKPCAQGQQRTIFTSGKRGVYSVARKPSGLCLLPLTYIRENQANFS